MTTKNESADPIAIHVSVYEPRHFYMRNDVNQLPMICATWIEFHK